MDLAFEHDKLVLGTVQYDTRGGDMDVARLLFQAYVADKDPVSEVVSWRASDVLALAGDADDQLLTPVSSSIVQEGSIAKDLPTSSIISVVPSHYLHHTPITSMTNPPLHFLDCLHVCEEMYAFLLSIRLH